ncbi:hypothetical protein F8154_05820 [Alkaliphilus pronyensis]|uniref:Uncharacterized protein n=1 Tax=Alkaliphilus pronyensis TaxID=1482732 RepID=A0A6I0F064_9FIRM|nr:hypothetical protein [Alkaliphilus pronyensis]KAB3535648.1 hypothetical protein F8154_05820 [Alkaliphilus pronyensis]
MSIVFPIEKIPTRPNLHKNRKIKRDAVWINNRFVCPLCFKSDYRIIKALVDKLDYNPIKYIAKCNECGIKLQYNKPVPVVDN